MQTDREKAAGIVRAVRSFERRLRRRHAFLAHQDAIGLFLFLTAAAGFVASAFALWQGIPLWITVPAAALFASILHEIEHDLIHDLYYRKNRFLQNLMFAVIWLLRPNTISPWKRKGIHLLHHRTSGSEGDIEERLITNGMPYGIKRFLCMLDGFLNMILRRREVMEIPGMRAFNIRLASLPMVPLFYGTLAAECAFVAAGYHGPFRVTGDFLFFAWILPNLIRQACLVFLSSSMHYFGDVNSVYRQTQVLNAWYFWPLQLFAFNFGATHGIHHFVVNQPFYLREWIRPQAHAAFRRAGIRFNDLGTFRRANRYAA